MLARKVEMLRGAVVGPGGLTAHPGEVVEVPAWLAAELEASGKARPWLGPAPEPESAEVSPRALTAASQVVTPETRERQTRRRVR